MEIQLIMQNRQRLGNGLLSRSSETSLPLISSSLWRVMCCVESFLEKVFNSVINIQFGWLACLLLLSEWRRE